jgi:acyl-CoA synthetase (AMP-forming)/AMP-acid ligase II
VENNLGLFLSKRALLNPNREAYVDGSGAMRLSFRELNTRCNRLANALLKAGVKKGERIAFLLMNSAEFMEAYFSAAKIGAVVVPLNLRLVPDEL